ncbi:MAG: DUF1016 N-terminal domain-containing protein [Myxococcales bacterium]|jgi:endonuclease YncB( thermonuclease family)
MAGRVISRAGYGRLLADVRGLLAAGRAAAESAAGHLLAVTYWKVGRRILEEELSEGAGYGQGVVEELAGDLGMHVRTLQYALRFARMYEAPPQPGLSWAHYKELLGVPDAHARALYAKRVRELGWSRRELAGAISAEVQKASSVTDGKGRVLKRPTDANYLYRCSVERVIDGDSLLAHVDLGFDVIRVQRMRLVNVQAPEAKTAAGKRATAFVRRMLTKAQTVVVKTARSSDARGRYLCHVFHHGEVVDVDTGFREGRYLNAELVRYGHGTVYWDPARA